MLDELKAVLAREGVAKVAIIDDAYDRSPSTDDIDDGHWNFFLDDLSDDDEEIIRSTLPGLDPRVAEARRNPAFVDLLWKHRDARPTFKDVFGDFAASREAARRELGPLERLLETELGLTVSRIGTRAEEAEVAIHADLIFLDMYLGSAVGEEARKRSVSRVKAIAQARPAKPPLVVLISSSVLIEDLRDTCRDEAELLGSQFRALAKPDAAERDIVLDLLLRLTSRYRDTLAVSAFLDGWRRSLESAQTAFLLNIRRLDLRDYADIQRLVLDAEGARVGSHMLETYDQFFHHQVEGNAHLRAAGHALDAISWENVTYPTAHFLPSSVANLIADGLMFHHQDWIDELQPADFGDVFLFESADPLGAKFRPSAAFERGERLAIVLLTQACDIQQCTVTRLLFIVGVARPGQLVFHERSDKEQTPIMFDGETRFVVQWDFGAPLTWRPEELSAALAAKTLRRARRLRTLYALQLQQAFAGKLTRVGTPVMLPPQYNVGVSAWFRDKGDDLRLLAKVGIEEAQAVARVGRTEKKLVDLLTLASGLVATLRVAMQGVDPRELSEKWRKRWVDTIQKREFWWGLEQGISFVRDGNARPLSGTEMDIIHALGPWSDRSKVLSEGGKAIMKDAGPLFLDISAEARRAAPGLPGGVPERDEAG